MKQIVIEHKHGMLDGEMIPINLDLRTLSAVSIYEVTFSMSARLIVCDGSAIRDRLIRDSYQFLRPTPVGVIFEVASNVYFHRHDFVNPCKSDDQRMYLRCPQVWAAPVLKAEKGKLPCIIEARCGNKKHPAHIKVTLLTS